MESMTLLASTGIDLVIYIWLDFMFVIFLMTFSYNGLVTTLVCFVYRSMSIILTAFLVNELMSPVSMLIQRQAAELLVSFFLFLSCVFAFSFFCSFAFEPLHNYFVKL